MNIKLTSAIFGGIAGAFISIVSSYLIADMDLKQRSETWNNEFAVTYSKLLSENPDAAKNLAKQFSIGLIIKRNNEGETEERYFIPHQFKIAVGRKSTNDIVITDSTVSRNHGLFYYKNNVFYYRDLSSKNNAEINGKKSITLNTISSGDKIKIGSSILEFQSLIEKI